MTLKNSFLTNIFENFKRRTWLFALSCLFFFFYFPVLALIYIQHITSLTAYSTETINVIQRIQTFMMELTGFGPLSLFIVTVAAFLCAIQGYSYVHNRKKIDFYHCLPVTKTKRFFTIYLNGFLAFFLPYFVCLSLALLIFALSPNVMTAPLFWNAAYGLLFNSISFLAIYSLVIIAVMLTGRGVITFLGVCVLMLYEFLTKALLYIFSSEFFQTYNPFDEPFLKNITSPVIYIATKLDSFNFNLTTLSTNWNAMTSMIPMILFYIFLYGIIAYFLYCKRPSEGGGKAIAFPTAKPIIKVFLVVPVSLFSAVLLKEITNGSYGFLLFGMIIGLLLSHGILEVIFEFDLRAAFHHGKQLLFSLGIIVVIYCVFEFDLIGYDKYLPKNTQLENAAILIYNNNSYYDLSEKGFSHFSHIDWRDYQSEHMQITDLALIEELVTSSVEFTTQDYDTVENSMNLNVTYRLKGGKEKYRSYTIDLSKHMELLNRLFISEEFKTSIYQIYDNEMFSPDIMNSFETKFSTGYQGFTLSPKQAGELLEIYKKELLNLTATEQYSELPMGALTFLKTYQYNYLDWSYPIYPSFTKTIQYLKDHRLYQSLVFDPATIQSIKLTNYNYRPNQNTEERINVTKLYTDPEEIAQITKALFPSSLVYLSNAMYDLIYDEFDIQIDFKDNTPTYNASLYLRKKDTPEFVLTDMKFEP